MNRADDMRVFDCISNGRQMMLPFHEAHIGLWRHDIGWIRRTEWIRWQFDGQEGQLFADGVVGNPGRFLGFQLLRRGNNILTIDRYRELLERDEMEANLFNAHAYRFNKLFGTLPGESRPIRFTTIPSDDRRGIPGYRLRPPLKAFLILGLGGGVSPDEYDWSEFYQPPNER